MISDGEFFSLFARMMEKHYKDPSGTPGLQASDLKRMDKKSIVVSAGALWTRFYIDRAVSVHTPDYRQIDFFPGGDPGDLSGDAAKPWNSSVGGMAKFWAPGEWHAKTPLLPGDVEGKSITLLVSDAALGVDGANLTASDLVGAPLPIQDMNVKSIGGTAQSGLDLSGKWAPRTPVAPGAAVGVTNVSGLKLAARPGRKFLYFYANNFATGCSRVTVSFVLPAVDQRGFPLTAGDESDAKTFDATSGIFEGAVYAVTDVGTADIYFVEAT